MTETIWLELPSLEFRAQEMFTWKGRGLSRDPTLPTTDLKCRVFLCFFFQVGVSDDLYHFIHDLWLENQPIGELS